MAGEIGYGLDLAYATTSGGTYTSVANLEDATPPKYATEGVDNTSHASSNAFRDKTPGMTDPGEITFKGLLSKASWSALESQLRVKQYWKLTWPLATGEVTASKLVCFGFLSDLAQVIPLDKQTEIEGKIILSGKPTFTAGS